jgi:hypothetical protein
VTVGDAEIARVREIVDGTFGAWPDAPTGAPPNGR